ncbi:hypothetical protein MOQ_006185 [Trypanosoma cruzi marinkellei]|uniref:Transmembrane protein n=1 Tax=Trypanosoma cruzi marinkellei TaxID=85056 RepID=K2NME3_TRYCR|nr:hypothetical protein MOQ_006185 [Trypanosoma cruzi marinkellei]
MDAVSLIREEIVRIREETERSSCLSDESSFLDARSSLLGVLNKEYDGSYFKYFVGCMLVPFVVLLTVMLLCLSTKMLTEWVALRRISGRMSCHPLIQEEMQARELSQASRRSARWRTAFVVTLKCVIASALLFFFVGSRVMMEVLTRGWIKGLLVPTGTDGSFAATDDNFDPWLELYSVLATLLSVDWFRDIQGLFAFSLLGSTLMVVGLRLLRSASEDVVSMRTDSISSLKLLQKIDDKQKERGQEIMQRQMASLISMLAERAALHPEVQRNGNSVPTLPVMENGENSPREDGANGSLTENHAEE